MKIAHLIMAYKDPSQIERLVTKLFHEDFDFYIHIDKKIDQKDFAYLAHFANVQFTKSRVLVRWAGYSFTRGVLLCVNEILESKKKYDFISLMSAQDYPIKPVAEIHNFFKSHIGLNFISCEPFGSPWWERVKSRVEKYHSTDFNFRGQYSLQAVVNKLMPKRKFPMRCSLYGGECATWWTISTDCAKYVVEFLKNRPRVRIFSKFTWAPDEFLIVTIIMNSHLTHKVINNNLRYIDWSQGGANPKILTARDFQALKTSDKFFARKFDITRDTKILDLVDEIT